MKLVRARLGNHVYVRARASAEFGGRDIGLNLELLDGVDGGLHAVRLEEGFVVVHAVQRVVVVFAAKAADGNCRSRTLVDTGAGSDGAGHQGRQLREAAAIQRQLHYFLVIDRGRDSGGVGLQLRATPFTSTLWVTSPTLSADRCGGSG